ncbi:MAG: GIDE domain-containing protein [Myxococcota bacterium]
MGILLVLVGLGAAGFGFWQWRKLKMIGGAPLAKSGQIVGNASDKGLVAVEGNIETPEPLMAPCSGKPCLYYEVQVFQRWQKYQSTGDSSRKVSGKTSVKHDKIGGHFQINDGSGPAKVDATEAKVNGKLEKSFEQEGNSKGHLTFGNYEVNVPPYSGEGWGTGSLCIEKIIPAEGSAYVAGRLEGDTIMRKKNVGGRLLIAREGLEALEKSTKTKAIAGVVAAAIGVLGGGVMAATADSPGASDQLTLAPGFSPDPTTVSGFSGGMTESSTLGGGAASAAGCVGTVTENPDAVVTVSAEIPAMRVMVKSTGDTTLIVQKPDGTFLCNDDTEGYNPVVDGAFPPGEYKVWVGSYSSEDHTAYTLGFTSNTTLMPSAL